MTSFVESRLTNLDFTTNMVVSICFKLRITAIQYNLEILGNVLCFLEAQNSILVNVYGIQILFWQKFNQYHNGTKLKKSRIIIPRLMDGINIIKIMVLDISILFLIDVIQNDFVIQNETHNNDIYTTFCDVLCFTLIFTIGKYNTYHIESCLLK